MPLDTATLEAGKGLNASRDHASPADAATLAPLSLVIAQAEVGIAWRRYQAEYNSAKRVKMYHADRTLSAGVSRYFFTGVPSTEDAFAEAESFRQKWLSKKAVAAALIGGGQ